MIILLVFCLLKDHILKRQDISSYCLTGHHEGLSINMPLLTISALHTRKDAGIHVALIVFVQRAVF